jgi:hypothetical protein
MSSKTVERLGGVSRGKETILIYPELLLTPKDPGHWLHGKVPITRYDPVCVDMQRLCGYIRESGPKPVTLWVRGSGAELTRHVYAGNRTVIATRIVNAERKAGGLPVYAIECHCQPEHSLSEKQATELFGLANELQVANDWMTRIQGAAEQVRCGVPISVAWEKWNFPSEAVLKKCLREEGGILQAAQAVQDALAGRLITLPRALSISALPAKDQARALQGKERAARPTQMMGIRRPTLLKLKEAVQGDKRLQDLSAADLLGALLEGPAYVGSDIHALAEVHRLIIEARKPGRRRSAEAGEAPPADHRQLSLT